MRAGSHDDVPYPDHPPRTTFPAARPQRGRHTSVGGDLTAKGAGTLRFLSSDTVDSIKVAIVGIDDSSAGVLHGSGDESVANVQP
jgi:hypothetical protein